MCVVDGINFWSGYLEMGGWQEKATGVRLTLLSDGYVEQFGTLELQNGVMLSSNTAAAGPVTLSIRPEHLVLKKGGAVKMEVDLPEQLGATTLIHGSFSGVTTPITASLNGIKATASDDILEFDAPIHQVHIFNAKTGKRIS